MIDYLLTDEPIYARALSLGRHKWIVVGAMFNSLADDERDAVLAHELAHCEGHHTEQRVLCLLLFPFAFLWLCRWQEFAADRYAVRQGCAKGLLSLLKHEYDGGWFQPSHAARRQSIKKHDHPRSAPVTGYSQGTA